MALIINTQSSSITFIEQLSDPKPTPAITTYSGLSATIRSLFGWAIQQKFRLENGATITLAIDCESLAQYIFCSNKSRHLQGQKRVDKIKALYKKIDEKKATRSKTYQYFIAQIAQETSSLFSKQTISLNDFAKKVHAFEPTSCKSSYRGILYKVRKDAQTIGYVMGTSHVGTKETATLNPKINAAALKSHFIGLEYVSSFFADIRLLLSLNAQARQCFIKVNAQLDKIGLKSAYGAEAHLKGLSNLANNSLTSLENYDEFICAINTFFSEDTMSRFQAQEMFKMLEYVRDGDEEKIEQYMQACLLEIADKKEILTAWKKLTTDRNPKMIEKAAAYFRSAKANERTFIAVGAGHLIGKTGVIQGLRDKGYTLVRVM